MSQQPISERLQNQTARGHARAFQVGPLTAVLIGISVAVAIWSKLGENDEVNGLFFITEYAGDGDGAPFEEIMHGQVWRILTPMFLHFGIMHLLFNMMWLKDLGTVVEKLVNTRTLLLLTIISEIIGNVGQYFVTGPYFGGMSGVVYCLFGYVWMKAKFDPTSGFRLDSQTVMWMVGWFVLCLTGAVGPVANVGHGVGLAVGVVWGFLSANPARSLR